MPLTSSLAERGLTSYDFSRWTGNQSGADFDFQALAQSLDCTRDFHQAGIIYADGHQRYLVRPSKRIANNQNSIVTHVVVTKVSQINGYAAGDNLTNAVTAPALGPEIASTALSCGAMLVTLAVAVAGSTAVPITAGASGALVAIAYAGGVATALQCVNGIYRVHDIRKNNAVNVNWLDSEDWYIATSTALDFVSLVSAGGALKEAVATYRAMKSVSSLRVLDWLKKYPRQDRARLSELIIRAQNPGITTKEIKAALKAGLYPKRFPIEPIQNELKKQLANTLTSMAAFTGSSVSGIIASPENVIKTGRYVLGTIQSLAVIK
ncbi:hypothetical protein [Brenneria corticis]|uniref:NAD synthetase n=1 Tax=Brenneria corticis TaxID=2173106 RepID=A0A2U1UAV6_9GAMM|nr:hypothetical protein [Brenneria sp. CFCC 11842]PWC18793.1 hypothetical protein DDT56_02180 [Brenneria sp. CFCC 11842]